MKPANHNKSYEKPTRVNKEIFAIYQDMKTHMLLYFFMALEWITGSLKKKESRYISSIGLS